MFFFVGKRHEASMLFTKMRESIKPGMVYTIAETSEIMLKTDIIDTTNIYLPLQVLYLSYYVILEN